MNKNLFYAICLFFYPIPLNIIAIIIDLQILQVFAFIAMLPSVLIGITFLMKRDDEIIKEVND